jgi:selenophosphate synthase
MVSGTVDSTELLEDIFEEECLPEATTKRNRRIQIFRNRVARTKRPDVLEAPQRLSGNVLNINIARARSMTQWLEPSLSYINDL